MRKAPATIVMCAALAVAVLTTLGAGAASAASYKPVWLCRPGTRPDPCTHALTATVIGKTGVLRVQPARPAKNPPIDCFYVYPTVSGEQTINADLQIQAAEQEVAVSQASRFSQVCRVYAPMYPQLTLKAIFQPTGIPLNGALIAYAGVAKAFAYYLAHFNHGRGIVFIGHSQGASVLDPLLKYQVDSVSAVRRRLVSALLMGGNVKVVTGHRTGGDFKHIPSCRSSTETGCVVAYSSFSTMPASNSLFGRVGFGLAPAAKSPAKNTQVMCVNPASPHGGSAPLLTNFPVAGVGAPSSAPSLKRKISTPWVAYPDEYTARCRSTGGATWLQVNRPGGKRDHRPGVVQFRGARWGLHIDDVNLALGNLVDLVRSQARAYVRHGG